MKTLTPRAVHPLIISVAISGLFWGMLPGVSNQTAVAAEAEQATPNDTAIDAIDITVDQADALDILGEAVGVFDELTTLPESHWIKRDQASAESDISNLIDDAINVLNVPGLADMRRRYRDVEDRIAAENQALSELREKRLLAPDSKAGLLTRYTPTHTLKGLTAETRGDFDLLIEARMANREAYQRSLENMRLSMSSALAELGIEMPPDQLELWLSAAIGDDVISMSVVFESIRELALRLEELTAQTNENLGYAKRYYGMLVILHKMIVQMQEQFIDRVDDEVLPKLQAFRDEADILIAESRQLMREGSHRDVLEQNIAANELTKRAIALYERVVNSQRDKVSAALVVSRKEEAIAANTYRTVRLGASVANLIREGINTFETLSRLQVPEAAEFQNAEIREEFRKLTERMENTE